MQLGCVRSHFGSRLLMQPSLREQRPGYLRAPQENPQYCNRDVSQTNQTRGMEGRPLFYTSNHVTIKRAPLQNPKPGSAPRMHQTPTAWKRPHSPDLQHSSKIYAGISGRRFRWQYHSESRSRRLQAAPQHQSIPNDYSGSGESVQQMNKNASFTLVQRNANSSGRQGKRAGRRIMVYSILRSSLPPR